jgi:hypothetical protein
VLKEIILKSTVNYTTIVNGVDTFNALLDTDNYTTANIGQAVVVNSTATGLTYVDFPTASDSSKWDTITVGGNLYLKPKVHNRVSIGGDISNMSPNEALVIKALSIDPDTNAFSVYHRDSAVWLSKIDHGGIISAGRGLVLGGFSSYSQQFNFNTFIK